MSSLREKASELVERFVMEAIESGLTWDEAVAVFGLAAKASAVSAAEAGDGTLDDCVAHAHARLQEAFAQEVHVAVVAPAMESLDAANVENALLATARRRQTNKLH